MKESRGKRPKTKDRGESWPSAQQSVFPWQVFLGLVLIFENMARSYKSGIPLEA